MADVIPNYFKVELAKNNVDLASDSFSLALLDSNHSNNVDTQENLDDVNGNEVSGPGYSSGGQGIANTTVNRNDTDDQAEFDGDDVTFSNSTIDASYAVIYQDTGTASTSTIVAILDFGGQKSSDNGDFTVSFGADGIAKLA